MESVLSAGIAEPKIEPYEAIRKKKGTFLIEIQTSN
jgi:hypothetical protein